MTAQRRRHEIFAERLRGAAAAVASGRWSDAERGLAEAASIAPAHPDLLHLRGLAARGRGELADAATWVKRALAAAPSTASYWTNLGLIEKEGGRLAPAQHALEQAVAIDPGYAPAHNALGAVLAQQMRYSTALACFERALALVDDPDFRTNRANAMLRLGRVAQAWADHRYRHGDDAMVPNSVLPGNLTGAVVELVGEQGLGDQLFFLRFLPLLVARGASIRLGLDQRLQGMLTRSGIVSVDAPATHRLRIGDLPYALGVDAATTFPDVVALRPDPVRLGALRADWHSARRPVIAVAWRAGGRIGDWNTIKEVDPQRLGAALRGVAGTIVVMQRDVRAEDLAAFLRGYHGPMIDTSRCNDDLDDALAVLACVDSYVGVSSTNLHLALGVGTPAHVLVPHPPDWRFIRDGVGEESPWYRGVALYRQAGQGSWARAFTALGQALTR
jgi:hypothetical protein